MASPTSSCSTAVCETQLSGEEITRVLPDDQDGHKAQPLASLSDVVGCLDLLHIILMLTVDTAQPQHCAVNVCVSCSILDGCASINTPFVFTTAHGRLQGLGIHEPIPACLAQNGMVTSGCQVPPPARHTCAALRLAPKMVGRTTTQFYSHGVFCACLGYATHTYLATTTSPLYQGCPVTCELLTDAFCLLLATHAPRLQVLRLSSCYRITDVGLQHLAAAAPPLCHVELLWSGQAVTATGVLGLAARCPGTCNVVQWWWCIYLGTYTHTHTYLLR